jgi:predicted DNA-binding transcriptional regulator AlpA
LSTTPSTRQRFVRARDLIDLLQIGRSTWYAWRAAGRVPAGVRIAGVTLYHTAEVLAALGLEDRRDA